MRRKEMLANSALLLCSVIWGVSYIFQKQAAQYMEPFSFIYVRYMAGVLSLLPVALLTRSKKAKRGVLQTEQGPEQWRGSRFLLCALLASLANCGGSVLVQLGLATTAASKAGFITDTYIALVPVLGLLLFRHKTPPRTWIGIVMALVGLYLLCVTQGTFTGIEPGDAAIMASSVCFAMHILLWNRFTAHVNGVWFVLTEFFMSSLMAAVIALFTETVSWEAVSQCVVPILFTGVLGVSLTYTVQIYCQRYTDPSVAALLMSAESVFAAIGGVIVLGERLSLREWIGCAVMLVTIVFVQFPVRTSVRRKG